MRATRLFRPARRRGRGPNMRPPLSHSRDTLFRSSSDLCKLFIYEHATVSCQAARAAARPRRCAAQRLALTTNSSTRAPTSPSCLASSLSGRHAQSGKRAVRADLGGHAMRPGIAVAATHYDEQALLAQRVPQRLDSHHGCRAASAGRRPRATRSVWRARECMHCRCPHWSCQLCPRAVADLPAAEAAKGVRRDS